MKRQRSAERPITVCAESLRRAMIGEILDVIEPELPELTKAEWARVCNGDLDDVIAARRPAILAWRRHVLRLPDWYVSKYSFGLELKRKVIEAEAKLALPETVRVALDMKGQVLTDDALFGLLEEFGLFDRMRIQSPRSLDGHLQDAAAVGRVEAPPVGVEVEPGETAAPGEALLP